MEEVQISEKQFRIWLKVVVKAIPIEILTGCPDKVDDVGSIEAMARRDEHLCPKDVFWRGNEDRDVEYPARLTSAIPRAIDGVFALSKVVDEVDLGIAQAELGLDKVLIEDFRPGLAKSPDRWLKLRRFDHEIQVEGCTT